MWAEHQHPCGFAGSSRATTTSWSWRWTTPCWWRSSQRITGTRATTCGPALGGSSRLTTPSRWPGTPRVTKVKVSAEDAWGIFIFFPISNLKCSMRGGHRSCGNWTQSQFDTQLSVKHTAKFPEFTVVTTLSYMPAFLVWFLQVRTWSSFDLTSTTPKNWLLVIFICH